MKRSLFTAFLSGALVVCSVSVFADTTEGGNTGNNGGQRWGGSRGGMRGGMRGGQRWGGPGGGMRGGQRWGGSGGGMRGGMGFGGMMLGRISRESEIEKKFPKEYAEVAKQLIDAENKLQELAKKAKVELPSDNNNVYRQLKIKAPAEFAEIEKKLNARETMRDGFTQLRALAEKHQLKLTFGFGMGQRRGGEMRQPENRPQMRRNDAAKVRAIREKFPKDWEKYRDLRREGKNREAEELVRELMRRLNTPQPSKPAAEAQSGK